MTDSSKVSLEFAAITDIGCTRSNNEDSYGYDGEQHIYAVCDGMGGRAAGEIASNLAVRTLIESYGLSANWVMSGEPIPLANRLLQAILDANQAVRQAGIQNAELNTMGTTLVCACFEGDHAVIGNVGDSRAYLVRDGYCQQITQDHSLLAEALQAGDISLETAAASNLQSVITRAIGVEDTVDPDLFASQLQPGDVLLLASDGLTRYAQQNEILAAIENTPDLTAACQSLVDFAKSSGGVDNITCILVRFLKEQDTVRASAEGGLIQNAQSHTPPDETEAFTPLI
jgi:serine/threonine protein phosphatase PrpC